MKNLNETINEIKRLSENTKTLTDYNNYVYNQTLNYQKRFGFKMSKDPEHQFWNNEADAFKHAFLSADLALNFSEGFSKNAGDNHEDTDLKKALKRA